jgi:hypothetical protein
VDRNAVTFEASHSYDHADRTILLDIRQLHSGTASAQVEDEKWMHSVGLET